MTAIEDCRATQFMRPLSILRQYRRHTSRTAARARIKCTVLIISGTTNRVGAATHVPINFIVVSQWPAFHFQD
jgi:hypothetical protein